MARLLTSRCIRLKTYKIIIAALTIIFCGWNFLNIIRADVEWHEGKNLQPDVKKLFGQSHSDRSIRNIIDICKTIGPGKYSDWTEESEYYIAQSLSLSYCVMGYDMDDIWVRIFDIFQGYYRISDYEKIRFPRLKGLTPVNFESSFRRESETLLYVRNPYSRLYVAYHDRFHLAHYKNENKCVNITFQEFLDKVITHVKLRQNWGTSWFSPLVPKCRLCDIKIASVIKEEQFVQDLYDFSSKIENHHSNKTIEAVKFLQTEKLFLHAILMAKLKFRNLSCNYSYIGPMMWKSLQFMGLINSAVSYPESLDNANTSSRPGVLVRWALRASSVSLTGTEKLQQRQIILSEAYRSIKGETIQYIQEIYRYDFEMFGYPNERPV